MSDDFTAILPPLSSEAYDALKADIAERGVLVPVTHDQDGVTIDGYHREKVARELGRDVPVTTVTFSSLAERKAWALAANVNRRNLTPDQRAIVRRFQQETYFALRDKDGLSQAEAAAKVGVARRTGDAWEDERISNVKGDKTYEPPQDNRTKIRPEEKPKIAERVAAGEPQAQIAADFGITQPRVSQIAKREEKQREKTVARKVETSTGVGEVTVHHLSAVDLLESLEPESVDLLLTDPPYETDVDDIAVFAYDWVDLALSRVKDTGRVYICCGAYPRELWAYLDVLLAQERFTVGVPLVWVYRNTLGPAPTQTYKTNWQAIMHAYGPTARPLDCRTMLEQNTVQDISAPDGRQGTRLHKWQKPDGLAERLIQHSTRPGELVLDPFAGTGTFAAAAVRLGRNAITGDADTAMLSICADRGLPHAA